MELLYKHNCSKYSDQSATCSSSQADQGAEMLYPLLWGNGNDSFLFKFSFFKRLWRQDDAVEGHWAHLLSWKSQVTAEHVWGNALTATALPCQAPQQPSAGAILWQEAPGRNPKLTSNHQPKEFGKVQRRHQVSYRLPESSSLASTLAEQGLRHQEGLSQNDGPETSPVAVRPDPVSHVVERFSRVPCPPALCPVPFQ